MAAVAPRSGGTAVAATGAGLLALAVALYATQLSRAVGVVVASVAGVVLIAGLSTRWRSRWPHRSLLVAFAVVVAGLVVLGVWLLIVGLTTTPSSS
jgi:hypothetical protein